MESKRLPAQFGLTAKQAFVPVLCVCVCWGLYRRTCICMSTSTQGCVYLLVKAMYVIQDSSVRMHVDRDVCAFMHVVCGESTYLRACVC